MKTCNISIIKGRPAVAGSRTQDTFGLSRQCSATEPRQPYLALFVWPNSSNLAPRLASPISYSPIDMNIEVGWSLFHSKE